MDEHVSSLSIVASATLLGAMSPGPDFLVVMRNNLLHSRKIGLLTALGVSLAFLVHVILAIFGIGFLLTESSTLFLFFKYGGALYLFYLGLSSILSSFQKGNLDSQEDDHQIMLTISGGMAIKQGFLTHLLNPKAFLFLISLFSQFIGPTTPLFWRIEYAVVSWLMIFGWFTFFSLLISHTLFRSKVENFRAPIERVMGVFLILMGLKMFF